MNTEVTNVLVSEPTSLNDTRNYQAVLRYVDDIYSIWYLWYLQLSKQFLVCLLTKKDVEQSKEAEGDSNCQLRIHSKAQDNSH